MSQCALPRSRNVCLGVLGHAVLVLGVSSKHDAFSVFCSPLPKEVGVSGVRLSMSSYR